MADYSLGTAEGTIKIGYDGKGINQASSGMDDLDVSARKVQRSFQTVATTTGIAAGAIAAGIGFAVNSAIDFEKQISAIGAVSGATADELEILRKKALQLGADTVFSASDAAIAMEELAKSGLSVTDIMGGAADATVALAAAGGVALPEAAAIASNAMNQFALAASDLPKVADLIAGAANASAIDVHDFGFAMSQAGAVAHLVGVNFEDLATAIALMGNQGIKGSDAGTSLKTMLQNLQPVTTKQKDLMEELGIVTADGTNNFFDQEGHLKRLAEVSGILNTALSGMTDQQKSMALETIFGSDAIRAAAIFAGQGAEGFNAMAESMAGVTAEAVAAQRLDNVAGSIEQLKGSAESAAIAIGTALLPTIRKITDFVTGLVNKFNALDPKWQQLIAFAAVAGAALLGVVAAIAAVGAVIAGVVAAAGAAEILAIILAVVAAVALLGVSVKALWDKSDGFRAAVTSAFTVAKSAVQNFGEALGPIIDFVKNELIPKFQETQAILQEKLEPAFRAIAEFITTKVDPAFNKIKDSLDQAMPTILQIARFLSDTLFAAMKKTADVIAFLVPIVLKLAGPVFGVLVEVISFLIRNIPTFVHILETIIGVIKIIGTIIGIALIAPFVLAYKAGQFLFEGLQSLASTFASFFAAIWGVIGTPVIAAFNLIRSIVETVFTIITAVISVAFAVISAIFGALFDILVPPFLATWNAISDAVSTAFDFIVGLVKDNWDIIKAVFDAVYNFIVPPIVDAFNAIVNAVTLVFNDIKDKVSAGWEVVKQLFSSAIDFVVKIFDGIRAIVDKVKAFFGQLKDAADQGIGPLFDFVRTIPGKILDALGNVGAMLFNAGKSLIQGFWDGIKAIWNSMAGWVESKMGALRNLWPFSPAKTGPFSGRGWVLYSGRALMEGFAQGMAERTSMVQDAAKQALAGVAGSLPTDFSAQVSSSQANAGLLGAASGSGGTPVSSTTTSSTEINLNVPLEDLRSIRDVQDLLDFIDRLRNDSRRGLEVGV